MHDYFTIFAPLTEDTLLETTSEAEAHEKFAEMLQNPWNAGLKLVLEGWQVFENGERRSVLASGRVCEV